MVVGDLVYIPNEGGPYEIISVENEWVTAKNRYGQKTTVSRYTARKLHDVIAVLYRMYRSQYLCDTLSQDDLRLWDKKLGITMYIMNNTLTVFNYSTALHISISLCDPAIFDKVQEFLGA